VTRTRTKTATHRPAAKKRRFRHDELIAVDLFSGFGGLTRGIEQAGFTTIMAANHNAYKVEVHEANHPHAEHWIADLVDPESSDYHSARDLPAADLLVAGVSCVNHSQANTQKAYEQRLSLFDLDDPDFEARVTRSERDRATANCVLHYAERHHPRMILIECTTELYSWGPAIPGRPKVGDGTTYRWWLKQFTNLGYRHKVLYLNSQFFGVPQSRDRLYVVFWDKTVTAPDLDHRPMSWCGRCDEVMPAVWSWKTGIPPTGSVRYGKQYNYTCPRCRKEVIPPMAPSLNALDLTDLGTRIGDRKKPLAPATMARAERCRQRFARFPAVLMPAKSMHGVERHPWQPMSTQTSQQETALLSSAALTGQVLSAHRHNGDGQHITRPMDTVTSTHEKAVLFAAVDSYQGAPRGVGDALPTQTGSETMALVTSGVVANRENATSRSLAEPMATVVGNAGSGGIGVLSAGVLPFRKNTVPTTHAEPMPTVTADQIPGVLTAASVAESDDTTGPDWWAQALAGLAAVPLDNCYFRMLSAREVGRGCGFDVDFPGYKGEFIVWGSARDQVDGFGNAVSPAVGAWIGSRLRSVLDGHAA
jgi:site-specific DNA-cytosine methylase